MTLTALTSDGGTMTTREIECEDCGGMGMKKKAGKWVACGNCLGTGVEPTYEADLDVEDED